MAKRTKKTVVDTRWEGKEESGRIVRDDGRYVKAPVVGLNDVQKEVLNALKQYDCIVFIAPAGCGKSYLVASEATDWLKKGEYDKLLLSRPAVGMGKTIGLLKGGLREKYEPFLLPLVDVITNRYGYGFYEASLSNKTIEMVPLEYIRGRDIKDVAIVDEFQNCTGDQAYTMLTRIADGGKLILIGDPTQNDLQGENALEWLPKFLARHPELQEHIKIIQATSDDIVRGGLCKMTVKAKEADLANK